MRPLPQHSRGFPPLEGERESLQKTEAEGGVVEVRLQIYIIEEEGGYLARMVL
jgi:hypothetical protein